MSGSHVIFRWPIGLREWGGVLIIVRTPMAARHGMSHLPIRMESDETSTHLSDPELTSNDVSAAAQASRVQLGATGQCKSTRAQT